MEILPPENNNNKSQFVGLDDLNTNEKITHAVYLLHALALFNGLTAIIALVLNYIKRDEVKGTYLESHFTWQIQTFWKGFIICAIGIVTTVIGIGFIILLAGGIWYIIRIAKGWLKLFDKKPIENPSKFI